ncbi:MAG: c-type cytochrome biogenesis protein CcsB [Candidatus Desulfofervidaceae bacterium]|nr:c-type cytochrome biogenesis protein CcsB [Candidatus Desulfofervidaceae bacterium]MDL1970828.1 c-type cytochrome biogenesis protein CcsB [Candidatus Desulfofervidaceae bacterium]
MYSFYQLALVGYIFSLVFFFINLFSAREFVRRIATFALLGSFVVHTVGFILNWAQYGHFPILGIKSSLSFVAWLLALIYLILFLRFGLTILGTFFTPLIVLLMLISRIVPGLAEPPPNVFKSFWLSLHIGLSLIGDGLLAVAFCAGIMYLVQERQIKRKKLTGILQRLPSLSFLDTLNYHALILGFMMLTLGLLTGALYAQWIKGRFWNWDPKEVWSVITWLVYAVLIHQRLTVGWRGRQAAWLSIIGFCFLLFTFLGVNYLLHSYHRFG